MKLTCLAWKKSIDILSIIVFWEHMKCHLSTHSYCMTTQTYKCTDIGCTSTLTNICTHSLKYLWLTLNNKFVVSQFYFVMNVHFYTFKFIPDPMWYRGDENQTLGYNTNEIFFNVKISRNDYSETLKLKIWWFVIDVISL